MNAVAEIAPPIIANGLRRASHSEFFAAMNCNVHPHIEGRWNNVTGYIQEWRMLDGSRKLIGVSDGGTSLLVSRYWLP